MPNVSKKEQKLKMMPEIISITAEPNRAERRVYKKLRSWFTRTPLSLKRAKKIVKNTKQKNWIRKKINSLIKTF